MVRAPRRIVKVGAVPSKAATEAIVASFELATGRPPDNFDMMHEAAMTLAVVMMGALTNPGDAAQVNAVLGDVCLDVRRAIAAGLERAAAAATATEGTH